MNKKEIFMVLGTRAPSNIEFNICNNILNIKVQSKHIVDSNMQENSIAFESWMLCLKSNKKLMINNVILDWTDLEIPIKSTGHHNRFMYRVVKSLQYFSDWFSVDSTKLDYIDKFKTQLKERLVLNYPNTDAKEDVEIHSEAHIERLFCQSEQMYDGIAFNFVGHQLPVGVFKNKVHTDNAFFTRGHSAIDLWGINGDELWIFELKTRNKMIGVITELLFYMWLSEDVFINKTIVYDNPDISINKRNFNNLHDLFKRKASNVTGVILYDELHPAITDDVIDFIDKCFTDSCLILKKQKYIVDKISLCK